MRQRIEEAIRKSKARYTEVRVEETSISRIVYRGRKLETIQATVDTGGIVRSLAPGGGWGTSVFNDLDDLPRRVEEALDCARAVGGRPVELAEVPPVVQEDRARLEEDFRGMDLGAKREVLRDYNDLMLAAGDGIRSTLALYQDRFQTIYYGNSLGTWVVEERPLVDIYCTAYAVVDGDVQPASESDTVANRGFEAVRGREALAEAAARRALAMLEASPVVGGVYPVVVNQNLAGVFVHEAFGHLSESDFISENPEAQKMMTLGRRFGRPILNIADSGVEAPGGALCGTHSYDDEGVAMQRTQLVREGVLVGRLHSRESAARMDERPTGNARAEDYRYPPIVRMRNTFVENGDTSFEDMVADIPLGVYALKSRGGQTCLGNFSFSSAYAYMIRDGRVAEPVRDVVLAGNVFETLGKVVAVGDDFRWDCAGRCGKGQGPGLPVGMGSPHLRIEDVVVGGK
ncbi:MAG: TldD/PmbA family protein [Planctomycetes bacterium]|nr:TldD/PmbA family protein [Planctomycetota bacterium]